MNPKLILLSSLLFLQIPTIPIKAAPPSIAQNSTCKIETEDEFYSTKELQTLANKITVKVIGDNNGGSGTFIGKQGNNYLVLTNSHVVRGVNLIKLQTADGKTYSAEILPQNKFKNSDITLLKFQSSQSYCLAEISKATPDIDTTILAAGFSGSTGNIAFRSGEVKKTSNLKEGYEIGYSSNIEQGMSGGAIVNSMGELVGINGKSAYPILNTGYVYQNGKRPSEREIREMRKLSWGIPISTVLTWVDSDILNAYKLPLPAGKTTIPKSYYPKWVKDLEKKAKQFTVRIDSNSDANGSGIIIAEEGNTYTVLTSAHVLCESENGTPPCPGNSYEILAPDGNKYTVDKSSIKIEEGVDLAVVKFKSSEDYQVATLANYNPKDNDYIFTAGYPKLKNDSPWRFTVGRILDKEEGLLKTKQSDFQTNDLPELPRASSLTGGYELVYTSITYGGMSGGPVLDWQGRVIGIHGKAEGEKAKDKKTQDCGVNDGCQAQIGYSLGIPVNTFLGLVPRLGVKPQQIENTRPPQLDAEKDRSVISSFGVFVRGNASASQWLERGNQLWRLNDNYQAVKAFDEVIKQKPSFVYLAYYGKGLALSQSEEAIAALEEATRLKPDFFAAWKYLGENYRKLKQLDKALVAINKAIELQPQNPILYNQKYWVLFELKDDVSAEAAITEAIKLGPRAAFYSSRGTLYHVNQKWDLAIANYNRAIQINPEYAMTYHYRTIFYESREKWDLAIADYGKLIELKPKSSQYYSSRARLYEIQGKWDLALADYNKAIQVNPGYAASDYGNRAKFYEGRKKWDLALADYNKAIQINPKYSSTYYNRAKFYERRGKWDLALADYNKAIQIKPEDTYAYYNRAKFYESRKKWDLALADYNKVIQINPEDADAYKNRAEFYEGQKKWDLAIADYSKLIEIYPKYNFYYSLRARLYEKQEKWDLALADYNTAIQVNPEYAYAYANRARFYESQKKWDLALADYNKAIQVNPVYASAYNSRASFYKRQKKWDLALADYSKLIELDPKSIWYYSSRASLYEKQEKWDLALADYNKAIQINPKNAYAYKTRANIYAKRGNKQKGIQDLYKAAQLFKDEGNTIFYEMVMNKIRELQK
ncbi:MAG: tetratricopeptide repeat protein [Rivularia sp. (in: Bacteria)]|nr:tetratricopeptide repeat protein [Rivularia sp. MS3]